MLSTAEGIIHWDMETKMPPKAIAQRSEQLALLSRIHHKLGTAPEIGKLLGDIQKNSGYAALGQEEKRNIYLINKSYQEQTALPEKLVSDLAMQEALTINTWKKAKAKKDFNLYKPELEKLLALSKQAADILMKVKGSKTPYDALIDNFEPNMPSETISQTFSQLLSGLKPLIGKIEQCQSKPQVPDLAVPVENQRKIAQLITEKLGYDTNLPVGGWKSRRNRAPLHFRLLRRRPHNHPLLPQQPRQQHLLGAPRKRTRNLRAELAATMDVSTHRLHMLLWHT